MKLLSVLALLCSFSAFGDNYKTKVRVNLNSVKCSLIGNLKVKFKLDARAGRMARKKLKTRTPGVLCRKAKADFLGQVQSRGNKLNAEVMTRKSVEYRLVSRQIGNGDHGDTIWECTRFNSTELFVTLPNVEISGDEAIFKRRETRSTIVNWTYCR